MAINDALSALAQKLGLKTTRLQDLQTLREKLADDVRRNQDKLGELKTDVSDLDAKLRAKKKEYDAAGPGIRQIIKREFAILFKQQEQVLETLDGISSQLNNGTILLHKVELEIANLQQPNREDDFSRLIVDIEISSENRRAENNLARELDGKKMPAFEDVSDARIEAIDANEAVVADPVSHGTALHEPQDELDRMIAAIN